MKTSKLRLTAALPMRRRMWLIATALSSTATTILQKRGILLVAAVLLIHLCRLHHSFSFLTIDLLPFKLPSPFYSNAKTADTSSGVHCEYGSLNQRLQQQLENRNLLRMQLQESERGKRQHPSIWDCPTCIDTNVMEQLLGRKSSTSPQHGQELCTSFEITVDMRDSSHAVEQYEFQKTAMQETIVLLQKNKEQIEQIAASLYYTIELKDAELEAKQHRIEALEASSFDAVQGLLTENSQLRLQNDALVEELRAARAEVIDLEEGVAAHQIEKLQLQEQQQKFREQDAEKFLQLQLQLNKTHTLLEEEKLTSEENQRLLEATEAALEQLQQYHLHLATTSCSGYNTSAEAQAHAVTIPQRAKPQGTNESNAVVPFGEYGFVFCGLIILFSVIAVVFFFVSEFIIRCYKKYVSIDFNSATAACGDVVTGAPSQAEPCILRPQRIDLPDAVPHYEEHEKLLKQSGELKERREELHRQLKHINETMLIDSERVLASQCLLQSEKSALLLQLHDSGNSLKHAEQVIGNLQQHLESLKKQQVESKNTPLNVRSIGLQTSARKEKSPVRSPLQAKKRYSGNLSSPARQISSPFAMNARDGRVQHVRTPSTIKRKVYGASISNQEHQEDSENMQNIANRLYTAAADTNQRNAVKGIDENADPSTPSRDRTDDRDASLRRSPSTPADLKLQIKAMSDELHSVNLRLGAALQQEEDTTRQLDAKKTEIEGLERALQSAAEELVSIQRSHAEEDEIKDELLEAYRLQLETVSHELAVAKEHLTAAGEGESALKEQLLQRQKEIDRMTDALSAAEDQLRNARSMEEEACGDVLALNDEMVRQQQESVAALVDLQNKIDDLTSQNTKLMQQMMHANEHHAIEVHLLQTDLNTTSIELAAAVENLRALHADVNDDGFESKESLKEQLEITKRRCEDIETESVSQLKVFTEQLHQAQVKCAEQQEALSTLQMQLQQVSDEHIASQKELEQNQDQLKELEKQRDAGLETLRQHMQEIDQLRTALESTETDNAALLANVQRQDEELGAYTQHVKQSEQKMTELQESISVANKNINDLRRSVMEKEQIIRILEADIDAMQENISSASASLSVSMQSEHSVTEVDGSNMNVSSDEGTKQRDGGGSPSSDRLPQHTLNDPASPQGASEDRSNMLNESLSKTFARIQAEIDSSLPESALTQDLNMELDSDVVDDAAALLQRLALLRSLNEEKDEIISSNKVLIDSLQASSTELEAELAVTKQKLAEYENSISSLREHAAQVQRAQREWRQRHGRGFRSAPVSAANSTTNTPN